MCWLKDSTIRIYGSYVSDPKCNVDFQLITVRVYQANCECYFKTII